MERLSNSPMGKAVYVIRLTVLANASLQMPYRCENTATGMARSLRRIKGFKI
jgi:hypothetical protein